MFSKKISPHIQVLLAIFLSIVCAFFYVHYELWNRGVKIECMLEFVGSNFINALQLLAMPLVLFSIIHSMHSVKDANQLSRFGFLVFALYLGTTLFAACLGLLLGNLLQPGKIFLKLSSSLESSNLNTDIVQQSIEKHKQASGGFQMPDNFFALLSDNGNLVYVVIFAMLFGYALMRNNKRKKLMFEVCEGAEDGLMSVMKYIIRFAPIGVFCLIASKMIEVLRQEGTNILSILAGLSVYVFTVIFAFMIMLFIIYPLMVKCFSKVDYKTFIKTMQPAQLSAFSTSSSTAALPKTNEQVDKLNVSEKIRSFVLSLGATINMDGTSIYQVLTTLFVTQLFGKNLTFAQQIYVAGYVTISSIGVAGMPGASIITTSILLKTLVSMSVLTPTQVGLALALIYIPDRLLDMGRTTVNVTSDAAVACIVQAIEDKREELPSTQLLLQRSA